MGRGERKAAGARCASCGSALRPSHRFCPNCGAAVSAAPAARAGPSLQVSGSDALLEEQRKVVTVLFADLSGSTVLGERLDPEELRGILASYFEVLSRQIQRYGGTVDKYIGDAVMAVFGAPLSHEDDAERALSAALAMQGAIALLNDALEREHGVRLALRVGVNTGEVVAGLLAGDVQNAYTVVGDTVNTAQRLEAAAPLGQVLASATTRRLAIHSFEFETLPAVTLKGKAEPVTVFRVVRRRYEEIAPEATPLVGRERELDTLRAATVQAIRGRGSVIHLVGEAGVGKSRLVGELRRNLVAGIDSVTARCASFEVDTPYALVADLIRGVFRIHAADPESVARNAIVDGFRAFAQPPDETSVTLLLDVLGYGQRSTFDPEVKRRVLVTLLRAMLRNQSDRAPATVVIEDLHWIDAASGAVFAELVPDVPQLAIVLVATMRPGTKPGWTSTGIELAPLSDVEARALVEAAFGVPVDDALVGAILARTGGNPFFIEEVVKSLKESSLLVEREGKVAGLPGVATRVPATVQEVVEARIDRLAAGTKRVLHPAAVCGRTFWVRLIERLVPTEPVRERLALLETEAFVYLRATVPELTFAFRQALIQEVAYETQLRSQRRALHGAIAEATEALYTGRLEEFVDFLAYHYSRSEHAAKAASYLIAAGDRARSLYAKDEARRLYREALALAAEPRVRCRALEGLGDVDRLAGDYHEAVSDLERGLAEADGDPIVRARLLRKIGAIHQIQGATPLAIEAFGAALADLPPGVDDERALVLLEMGLVEWQRGDFPAAIDTLSRAIEHAERGDADDARAAAYRHLGTVYVLRGDVETALRYYGQSLAVYERGGDLFNQANVLNNMGIVHRKQGRYADALAAHERALGIRKRIGDPLGIGTSHNNVAQILRARGDLIRAQDEYRSALELWRSIGYKIGVAIARTGLGIARVDAGDRERGLEDLRTALGEWEALGTRTYLSETQRYVAQAYLATHADEAAAWAERAVLTARELRMTDQEGIGLQVLGLAQLARGRREEGIAQLEASREILRGTSERQELARTLAALGRAYRSLPASDARHPRADALLAEARAIFIELGAALELIRAEADPSSRAPLAVDL